MKLSMVDSAEGNGELVANLASHGTCLSKTKVMGVRWGTAADQTGLIPNIFEVRRLAAALRPIDEKALLL